MYSDSTIKDYLSKLASRSPAPGGGSAAALVGAIGVSLLSKVANFTIGKEKYKNVEMEITQILKQSENVREELMRLCCEDARAYRKLTDAFKLPKGPGRSGKVQNALKDALAVPLEVCKNAKEAIKLCIPLAKKGNTNLITDVGDACLMLDCAFKSAILNVEINLKSIKDEKFIIGVRKMLEAMEKEIGIITGETSKLVKGGIA